MSHTLHILGAGSIGLLMAYHLSKSKKKIVLIKKNEDTRSGNTLYFSRGSFHDTITPSAQKAQTIKSINTLLICTKAYDTMNALQSIAHAIQPSTTLILCQNGLGIHETLLKEFPSNPIYAAVTFEAAKRTSPMHVEHTGVGETTLGTLTQNKIDTHLQTKLNCALSIHTTSDIYPVIWKKVIANCCINPLTTLFDCLNGQLLESHQAMTMIDHIIEECILVCQSKGVLLSFSDLKNYCINIIIATSKNSSSMREDIKNGKMTEIDYLNGYITNQARQFDIPTPTNKEALNKIKELENSEPI